MSYEKQNFVNGLVLMAEHLNKIEDQIALNEDSINTKADVNHTHSYNLSGVLLDAGTQELSDGTLRIIDNNNEQYGFEVRTALSDATKFAKISIDSNGDAYFKVFTLDGTTENVLNYILLQSDSTSLRRPLSINSGGTGATSKESALANLGAASESWVAAQIQAAIDSTWEASY